MSYERGREHERAERAPGYAAALLAALPTAGRESAAIPVSCGELSPAELPPAELSPAELAPAELSPAELSPAELSPAELSPAELSPAELSPAELSAQGRGTAVSRAAAPCAGWPALRPSRTADRR